MHLVAGSKMFEGHKSNVLDMSLAIARQGPTLSPCRRASSVEWYEPLSRSKAQ